MSTLSVPRAFVWRRIHSLMGLWLVLFLIEHLLTNSQAALWLGDNGKGFVDMVNGIHNLPYLQAIEIFLLGVPILIHGVLGIKYLFTSKHNYRRTDGSAPVIKTGRNRAFSWQRITSWILLIGLILHVAKFRFIDYPEQVQAGGKTTYLVSVSMDSGLYTLADRLNVTLYDTQAVDQLAAKIEERTSEEALVAVGETMKQQEYDWIEGPVPQQYSSQKSIILSSAQNYQNDRRFVEGLQRFHLASGHVVASANDFGTASLLAVRNTFKSPVYAVLYTIFVLAACFHAFNGFWTFLITWGWVLKMSAQRAWTTVAVVLMLGVIFLGLAAIWGTYWFNLKY
ncbi:MAG: succinate dehydrogenase [Parachlamydiales bacterium]|nr:succinate dehydrogenase [Candidatus Acheromyda pituitae]